MSAKRLRMIIGIALTAISVPLSFSPAPVSAGPVATEYYACSKAGQLSRVSTSSHPCPRSWTAVSGLFLGADFSSADLSRANLEGVDLTGVDLTDANLTNANLTNANLTNANLTKAKLRSANLTEATLTNANFTGANLRNANLTNTAVYSTNFTNAKLTGVISGFVGGAPSILPSGWSLIGGYLVGAGADLTNANFQWANLRDTDLRNVNLTSAKFDYADLTRTDFRGSNLTNAEIVGADISYTDFRGTNLTGLTGSDVRQDGAPILPIGWLTYNGLLVGPGANLTNADLTGVTMKNVNLTGANLTNVVLTGAILTNAKLSGANLTNVVLTGARLGVANLTSADLTNVVSGGITGNPTLPPGWALVGGYLVTS